MKTAVVGGGAAGFFLAINLKEMCPQMEVTIFERTQHVLAKVKVSGGGRCNCTNSFESVRDLSAVYPRGHRLMKRLFNVFNHHDAYQWFERHGVKLVTQADECVFPASQSSQTIIDCFLREARKHAIGILTGQNITSLSQLSDYDFLSITTGGQPRGDNLLWLGQSTVAPVPSLFTLSISDTSLCELMGTVVDHATVSIPSTKFRAQGPLLITHWGVSGPAVLKLSSHAARHLHDVHYQTPLSINWMSASDTDIHDMLYQTAITQSLKQVVNARPSNLPQRLWNYLTEKSLGPRAHYRWGDLTRKDINRLVNTLSNDTYLTAGRAAFKDEFVTCGGIALSAVHPTTLESRTTPRLYFAGEVLDIDGVTGGFNFQAAWTTAYTVAQSIAQQASEKQLYEIT